MFVTVIAVLCHGFVCLEEKVVDSDMDDRITFTSCQINGQMGVSKWMAENPKYHTGWTLKKWKCVPGRYTIPGET